MPIIPHEYLWKCHYRIFLAAGVPDAEARTVATLMVRANLTGHDSHGVIRLPGYIDQIREGMIVPGAPFEISRETPTTAVVNGNWGFGFTVAEKAMRLAIKKAKAHGVAAITTHYHGHIGRLGSYSEIAAHEDVIGSIIADAGGSGASVVPYGGRDSRLGTNPMSIAIPSNLDSTVLLDMATCAAAMGKLSIARTRAESVPLGWIIDKEGNPTTDPNSFYAGLPFGGHKGYILSFVNDCFASLLSGMGNAQGSREAWEARHGVSARMNDCCFITAFSPDAFYPLADFKREVTEFAKYVTSSRPATGVEKVLYPGEIEWLTEQKRRKEGVLVEDETWERVRALIKEYKLENVFFT